MDISRLMSEIENHPRFHEAGMVLTHYGVVRSVNLKGQKVAALTVDHDLDKIETVKKEMLQRPGIVEIVYQVNQGRLTPGQPIMLVAVAGATRDKVFPVLEEMIDRIKKEGSNKSEELM